MVQRGATAAGPYSVVLFADASSRACGARDFRRRDIPAHVRGDNQRATQIFVPRRWRV